MVKNKKGYTLVELLGTILILGLLLLIGIPTIRSFINRGKSTYYTSLEKEMKVAGSEYLNTYRTLLPRVIGHTTVINLEEIEANNYIDTIVDEDGNPCTGQVMAVKKKKDGYDYHACLKCGTRYISKDENCKVSTTSSTGFENNELDNQYEDSANYRVVFDTYEYEVGQTEEFVLPVGRVEHLENGVWKEITATPIVSTKKIDTNSLGVKTITYSYHGSKTDITVNIVDKVAPSKPEIVVKYESANGNNYQGNWYSGKLYVEYKSTDYTRKNIIGSGIKYYEYSLDGENWTAVRRDNDPSKEYTDWNIIDANALENKIVPGDGEYTIRVRAVDKNDNVGEINIFVIKIDTKAPDCALKVTGDVGHEYWYKSGITVEYDTQAISGTTSNILTTPIVAVRANGQVITTGASSVTINTPEENIRVYGTITDEAGNVTVCEAPALDGGYRLKLDPRVPDAPTITVTDGNGVGGRWYTGNGIDDYVTTPATNVWHINDTTMTFSGANNLSKNIYFYTIDSDVAIDSTGRATNATNGTGFDVRNVEAANIKATQTENTLGTTYYVKVCSVAGNCSASSNYIVKLDKTTPNPPTITATDGKTVWYTDATHTTNVASSGVWHMANTTLTYSGANNISGNVYHYAATTALTANSYGRPDGTRNTSATITSNTPTAGTTYYSMVCSGAGRCSSNGSYLLKIDKTVPTIAAKAETQRPLTSSTEPIADYYNITSGPSGYITVCKKADGTVVTTVNQLPNVETVTCTVKSNAGVDGTVGSSTVLRKYFAATPNTCRNSAFGCETWNSGTSESACGCGEWNSGTDGNVCGWTQGSCAIYWACENSACPCSQWSGDSYSCSRSGATSCNGCAGGTAGAGCTTVGGACYSCSGCACGDNHCLNHICQTAGCGCYQYNYNANTCSNSAFGCKRANSCRSSAFGCETWNSGTNGSVCGWTCATGTNGNDGYCYY